MTVEKSHIRVNSLESIDGGPVIVSFGATIPSGFIFEVNGNASIPGTSTATSANVTNFTAGIVTATNFVGDGSQLTALPITSASKSIALYLVL